MARHQHRSTARPASQRQLRVGELVRLAMPALALLLVAIPASAEVCDKAVGESWRTEIGPVWLLNPVGFPIALTALLGGLVLVASLRLRWLGFLGAAFLVLIATVIVLAELVPEHEIYLEEIREGCRSHRTDLMDVAALAIFALAYAWFGSRTRPPAVNQ